MGKSWYTTDRAIASRLAEHATPEAKAALAAHVETVAASQAMDSDVQIPAPEGLAYLPFQRAGIAYALARRSTLIADEMGLGKTIQALGVVNADPTIRTVLVVCPATLRLNWKREAERWLVRPASVYVVEDAHLPPAQGDRTLVLVVNYDKLRDPEIFSALLMVPGWDLLIADEAHFAKNPKAKRTQALLGKSARKTSPAVPGLASRTKKFLALTGTPILNKPIEVHTLLAALAPGEFGEFFPFARRYANAHQTRFGWDFSGASHLDELQERMRGTCMVRRRKADVLTELPPKRRQVIELAANGAAKLIAREAAEAARHEEEADRLRAEAELVHAERGDGAEYEAAVAKLREATSVAFTEMSRVRHELAVAKVPAVIEHAKAALEEEPESKIVIFAHHLDVIAALVEGLAEHGVASITGETPMADRQPAVDRFQTDSAVRVFVGGITAAGVGLTLTASSHVIMAELDWVPANVTQAEDRCHRIGQAESVLVQHLVFDGSLDARMAKALVAKQAIADKTLDRVTALEPIGGEAEAQREVRPKTYPKATTVQRQAAKKSMQWLAGLCDGARTLDGAGFAKIDVRVGHSLAEKPGEYTDGQTWLATRLARKYHRQLPPDLLALLDGDRHSERS